MERGNRRGGDVQPIAYAQPGSAHLRQAVSSSALGGFSSRVFSTDPIAYWRFDDASSSSGATAKNSSANGIAYDGTYGPGVTLVAGPSLPGLAGQAASFSGGVSGRIAATNTGFPLGNGARTVIAWVRTTKPTDNSTFTYLFEYGKQDNLFSANHIAMPPTSYGNPSVYGEIGTGTWGTFVTDNTPSTTASGTSWRSPSPPHGATNPDWSIFLDGGLKSGSSYRPRPFWTRWGRDRHGRRQSSNPTLWQGQIDEVAMFGTALTHIDIISLYSSTFLVPEPATVALLGLARSGCWPLPAGGTGGGLPPGKTRIGAKLDATRKHLGWEVLAMSRQKALLGGFAMLAALVVGSRLAGASPYSSVVLGDNPTHYWQLNKTSGSTAHRTSAPPPSLALFRPATRSSSDSPACFPRWRRRQVDDLPRRRQ